MESISRNRFLGSISAYKYGHWIQFPLLYICTTAEAEARRETTQHGVLPCLAGNDGNSNLKNFDIQMYEIYLCKAAYICIFMQSYLLSLQLLLYHSVLDFLILKHENKNKQASKRQESNNNFAQIPQQRSPLFI